MKKLIAWIVMAALALSMVLVVTASADEWTKYVAKSKLKAYAEPDTNSKVIKKLKGAQQVLLSGNPPQNGFTSILLEDTKHGGQMEAWVQSEFLSDELPQSLCDHDWGSWNVERESTCTERGYRWRLCNICGLRDENEPKKKAHEFGAWKVTKEATCSKKGERVHTCKNCGYEEKEEYLDDHTFGEWTLLSEPTCAAEGERVHTCKVCGAEVKQTLDRLPHDFEYRVTVEATDHSSGIRAQVCRNCGYATAEESYDPEGTIRRGDRSEEVYAIQQLLVEQGYLNPGGADGIFGGGTEKALMQYQQDRGLNPDGIAWPQTRVDLEHDYGPWTVVKPMTRTESGERVRTCQGCGFEQHEIIEAGTVFERGRRGEDVRALQQIIKEVGYDAGSFDGIYGKKLDSALAGFAADRGLIVEDGKIRPADVDAVMNAWIATIGDDAWMGEGSADSPVNLALTVNRDGEPDATGVCTYTWSLTNMGSEPAMFNALLLTFGEATFREDNLVMELDGEELKPGAANSASGSFVADASWDEGDMNFAALAVSEATGAKWLSNAVTFENAGAPEAEGSKVVAPVPQAVDVNNIPDGIYPVSFDRGDVLSGASGIYMNAVHIYVQDWYDIVDVSMLKEGDTIIVEGEEVPVLTLEDTENGAYINDGQDARSFYLVTEEDTNGFYILGLNDMTTYTEQGVTTLVVDPAATFTDGWDIESEPVTVSGEGIVEAMQASQNDVFNQFNTTVRVEAGRVVEIKRDYVP